MRVSGVERLALSTIFVLLSLLLVSNLLYGASRACPATGNNSSGQFSSGDFRAFYTAAVIAASSDYQRLYDLGFQAQKQEELDPGCRDQFLAFVYPAPVAVLMLPLSYLSYKYAYILHCAVMLLMLLASCYTFARWSLPTKETLNSESTRFTSIGDTAFFLAVSFSFLPLFFSIIHGQNSALLLFAVSLLYYVLFGGKPEGAIFEQRGFFLSLAGAFCLLLLGFKPQLLLPFLVFLVVYRQWRILWQFAGCAFASYLLSALYFGYNWIGKWLLAAYTLSATEYSANATQMLGIESLLFVISEDLHTLILPIYPIVYLLAVTLLLVYTTMSDCHTPQSVFVMLVLLLLITAPHVMYYEASLLVFCYAYLNGQNEIGRSILFPFLLTGVALMAMRNTAVLQIIAIAGFILFLILLRRIDKKRNLVARRTEINIETYIS